MKLNTRVQLTLLYGGLFFTMGLALLGATYLHVSDVLVDTRLRMAGAADVVPNHAILASVNAAGGFVVSASVVERRGRRRGLQGRGAVDDRGGEVPQGGQQPRIFGRVGFVQA